MTHVLISGASIAGPALAFWLRRAGVDVTVVEAAPRTRDSRGPIDLRGAAVDVVERMGVLEAVEAFRTGTRRITFVGARGRTVASFEPDEIDGSDGCRAVELPRGDLTSVLRAATAGDVEYRYEDAITALQQRPDGVEVTLRDGSTRTVDLVVGADGVHSGVRALAFGPEESYRHDLGYWYVGFSVPPVPGLDREARILNAPGRSATLYAVRDEPRVCAVLAAAGTGAGHRDEAGWRALATRTFSGLGGQVPAMLEHLDVADDLFADTLSQIRMPAWTTGRVALVGDAAYAPSFLSGQGTSLAVVGAYTLAAEIAAVLAEGGALTAALPAHELRLRDYVARNQALVGDGARTIIPGTRTALALRNAMMRAAPLLARLGLTGGGDEVGRAATAISLREDLPSSSTVR